MYKAEIRKIFKEKRRNIKPNEYFDLTNKMDDLLKEFSAENSFGFLLSYAPILHFYEIDPKPFETTLLAQNTLLQILYPVTQLNSMKAVLPLGNSEFQLGHMGVQEPNNYTEINPKLIDIILVPLLAFDKNGYRVGYGKGYYDYFLPNCSPDCIKMGVSFFEAIPEILDKNENDVPLDFCLTPNQLYHFR